MSACMSLMCSMVNPSKSDGRPGSLISLCRTCMHSVFLQPRQYNPASFSAIRMKRMDRIPVFRVEEVDALAEYVLVVASRFRGVAARALVRGAAPALRESLPALMDRATISVPLGCPRCDAFSSRGS